MIEVNTFSIFTDLRIRDKGQPLSSLGHSLHRDAEDVGGVAESGEHHNRGQQY